MVIATFGPTTGWVGKTVTYEGGQFIMQDYGPLTADQVVAYDRQGHLVWARDDLRAQMLGRAGSMMDAQPSALVEQAAPATTWPQAPTTQLPVKPGVVWGGGRSRSVGLSSATKTVIGVGIGLLVLMVVIGVASQSGRSGSASPGGSGGSASLTSEELSVVTHVQRLLPDLKHIIKTENDWVDTAASSGDPTALSSISTHFADDWSAFVDEWNLTNGGTLAVGNVEQLESDFQDAAGNAQDAAKGMIDFEMVVLGGGTPDNAADVGIALGLAQTGVQSVEADLNTLLGGSL